MRTKVKSKMVSPIREGQYIELSIHGSGHRGEGVGRYDGMVVFIPGAVPGDYVRARVIEVKRGYARAALENVLEPSPDRVTPRCLVFEQCGGCQLQHIAYDKQLELKRQQVVDALTRIGGLEGVTVHPTIGMDTPWEYRNKAQFPIGYQAGRVVAGFFAPRSHHIVDIEACDIQHPLGNQLMREVKSLASEYGVTIYDEHTHSGVLRHVIARVGRKTGEVLAVLVTKERELPHGREIAQKLMERIPGLVGVVQNINPERTNVVLGRESKVLIGAGYVTDYLGPFAFKISPVSFFQVNPAQTEILYAKVVEYAALSGTETVFDLYCGIGSIALFLAQQAGHVVGIEWVAEAVSDAEENAALNGIDNVRFIAGDAASEMPRLAREGVHADVIVVDPPRKGCEETVLSAMAQVGPERIVYVSCNPASLARDLSRLRELGYDTLEVQPVDMFPHTAHIECCALLTKRG